jgi:SAM-dependent methyltransferase
MNYEDNPRSIKYYVKRFLLGNREELKGKRIIDFPAGNGITSNIIRNIGAIPVALDLFPEYFTAEGLTCERANISEGLPLPDQDGDALICQEGIEHFSDQLAAFREFNRVLKPGGMLLVTTPNYSNIRAKLSYLLGETERFNSMMAPNELDSIWMSKQDITNEIYYGHIFLVGIQKLRVFGRLSGLQIKKVHFTRAKSTSMLLLPFFYPFIYLSNWLAYRKNLRKNKNFDMATKKEVYREIFKLATNVRILVGGDLMVEYEKVMEVSDVGKNLKSRHKEFGLT